MTEPLENEAASQVLLIQRVSFCQHLTNPKYRLHRYLALVVLCLVGLGNYYIYDNPGALESQIKNDMKVTVTQYTTLYSMYSWPNVILGLFGGFLIDRVLGVRLGAILFSLLICLGQLIIALGAYVNKFWLMQLGRFVFGLGGENLTVAVNTFAVSWYKGSDLNLVFGLLLSISRLGSTLNFITMKPTYDFIAETFTGHKGLAMTLLVADAVVVFSLLACFLMCYLDKRAEKILHREPPRTGEVIRLRDALYFGLDFWLVSIICVLYYITIFPFVGLGVVYFQEKFGLSESSADKIISSIYTFSAIAAPILGMLIDKIGLTISFVLLGTVITFLGHSLLAFTLVTPLMGVIYLSMGYSILACALWPMIPDIVSELRLGTAYGVVQCVQNLGFALANPIAGAIVESKGYQALEIFFLSSLILCIIAIMLLFASNMKKKGILNATACQKKARQHYQRTESIDSDAHPILQEVSAGCEDRTRKRRHTDLTNNQPPLSPSEQPK